MDSTLERTHPKRGRPRVPGTDEAILNAARTILMEQGWEAFSLAKVALAANVGKPTVYRRWPSRAALVFEAIFSTDASPLPDTGSARETLRLGMRRFVRWFSSDTVRPAGRALVAEFLTDAEVSRRFLTERMERDEQVITDAIQRNAPDKGKPREHFELLAELAISWVVHRCIIRDEPPSDEDIDRAVDTILTSL